MKSQDIFTSPKKSPYANRTSELTKCRFIMKNNTILNRKSGSFGVTNDNSSRDTSKLFSLKFIQMPVDNKLLQFC